MRKRVAITVGMMVGMLLILSCAVGAWWCEGDCPSNMSRCWGPVGDGGTWLNYYHMCDGMSCGVYDPFAESCQKLCSWNIYRCDPLLGSDYDCFSDMEYDETCLTQ